MKLTEFMQSNIYLGFLDDLDKSLTEKIDREEKVYDVIITSIEDWLECASMSIDDLNWVILNHRSDSINYIVKKLIIYTEPDGGEENIVNLPPTIDLPLGHLIEFYILAKAPEKLLDYMKKIRMPGAKKYSKEITHIFNEIKNES